MLSGIDNWENGLRRGHALKIPAAPASIWSSVDARVESHGRVVGQPQFECGDPPYARPIPLHSQQGNPIADYVRQNTRPGYELEGKIRKVKKGRQLGGCRHTFDAFESADRLRRSAFGWIIEGKCRPCANISGDGGEWRDPTRPGPSALERDVDAFGQRMRSIAESRDSSRSRCEDLRFLPNACHWQPSTGVPELTCTRGFQRLDSPKVSRRIQSRDIDPGSF